MHAVAPHSHRLEDDATRASSTDGGQTQQKSYNNNSNDGVGDVRKVSSE